MPILNQAGENREEAFNAEGAELIAESAEKCLLEPHFLGDLCVTSACSALKGYGILVSPGKVLTRSL